MRKKCFKISKTFLWLFCFWCFSDSRDYTSHNELPTKSGKLNKIRANRTVIRVNWCLKKLFETSCQRFDDQACKLLPGRSKISQTNRSGWNSPPPPPRTTCQPLFCERNIIKVLGHLLLQIHIYLSHIIYFPNSSFRLLAQTTLRNILGTKNLHEILSDRESISGSMQVRTLHASTSFGKIQSSGRTGWTRCTVHLAHFGQQPEIEICTQAIQPRLCFLNWD